MSDVKRDVCLHACRAQTRQNSAAEQFGGATRREFARCEFREKLEVQAAQEEVVRESGSNVQYARRFPLAR